MDGKQGQTCDGQPYSPELQQKLREAFDILKNRVYVLENPNQPSVNQLYHRKGNDNRAVAEFWKAVRDSKRRKVFVGPNMGAKSLRGAAEFLGALQISCADKDAFDDFAEILEQLKPLAEKGTIFIFSAGPASKCWIAELVANHPDVTCIDAGSTFDPMFVGQTRTEQLSMEECWALYDETAHLNPTKKWGLKMECDQFGNRVPEDFYDKSEIVGIEAFENVCLELRQEPHQYYSVIELGACQAYYSLLAKAILGKDTISLMVEPTDSYMARGKRHFEINGQLGIFSDKCIGKHWIDGRPEFDKESTTVDGLLQDWELGHIDILHADIDSNERVLLDTQISAFSEKKIGYVFLATHDHFIPGTHEYCKQKMLGWGYTLVLDEPRPIVGSDGLLVFSATPAITKEPLVSICIPTLGREDSLAELLKTIPQNAGYKNYEVIVERDSFENRRGAPKTLNVGVAKSKGELVMFLGNDCIPQPDFLVNAVRFMRQNFAEMDGLVGLNDGLWHGKIATHFLGSKRLLPLLGGTFFHEGYRHCGCDNELTERCRAIGKYGYCAASRILHQPKDDKVHKIAWDAESVAADRALLDARAKEFGFTLSV